MHCNCQRLVGRMKVEAYSNLEHLEPIAATPTTHDDLVSKLTGTQAVSYSAAYQGLQLPDHQGTVSVFSFLFCHSKNKKFVGKC